MAAAASSERRPAADRPAVRTWSGEWVGAASRCRLLRACVVLDVGALACTAVEKEKSPIGSGERVARECGGSQRALTQGLAVDGGEAHVALR